MRAPVPAAKPKDIKPSQRLCACGNDADIAKPVARQDSFNRTYFVPDPNGEMLCWSCYHSQYRKPDWRDQMCDAAAVDGATGTLKKMRDLLAKYRNGTQRPHR